MPERGEPRRERCRLGGGTGDAVTEGAGALTVNAAAAAGVPPSATMGGEPEAPTRLRAGRPGHRGAIVAIAALALLAFAATSCGGGRATASPSAYPFAGETAAPAVAATQGDTPPAPTATLAVEPTDTATPAKSGTRRPIAPRPLASTSVIVPGDTASMQGTMAPESSAAPQGTIAPVGTVVPDATALPTETAVPTDTVAPTPEAVPTDTPAPPPTEAPPPTPEPTSAADSQACYLFQNYISAELTVTFTLKGGTWSDTFKVGANSEYQYCLAPGSYTYTIDAPPPWSSINGELDAYAGDRYLWPVSGG